MKNIKMLVLTLMLGIGALSSCNAAVILDTVISGSDYESIAIYDYQYNEIGGYTSTYWEVDALIYDDQPGEVRLSWWTPNGVVYVLYLVEANGTGLTVVEGTDLLSFNAASLAMWNIIAAPVPPPSW